MNPLVVFYDQPLEQSGAIMARGIHEDRTEFSMLFKSMQELCDYVDLYRWPVRMFPADLGRQAMNSWVDDAADYLAQRAKEGPAHDL